MVNTMTNPCDFNNDGNFDFVDYMIYKTVIDPDKDDEDNEEDDNDEEDDEE